MLNTYTYTIYLLLHVSVFVTPSSGRILSYLLKKNYTLFEMLLHTLCYKMLKLNGVKHMYLIYYVHLVGCKNARSEELKI